MASPLITLVKLIISIIIIYAPIAWIRNYIQKNKISVPCMGCTEGGVFTKCSPGTGKGSAACSAYKATEQQILILKQRATEAKEAISGIKDTLMVPIRAIRTTMTKIGNLKYEIKLDLAPMPPLVIPKIEELNIVIDIPDIPDIDPGAFIRDAVNQMLGPINRGIGGVQHDIQKIIDGINKIPGVDIAALPDMRIPGIDPNFSMNIDFPKIPRMDIGATIKTAVNSSVNTVNEAIDSAVKGFNLAMLEINKAFKFIIEKLQIVLERVLGDLKKQLDSLNIFKEIVPKITGLFDELKSLDPIGALQHFLLPWVSAFFPGAALADAAIILAIIISLILITPVIIMGYSMYTSVSTIFGVIGMLF